MNIDPRLFIIGMLLVVSTMVAATQFSLIDLQYQYQIIPPPIPDYGIHYIGADNSSDGMRVLRVSGTGDSRVLKIVLGNWSGSYQITYTAAFGIVNEDNRSVTITHIEVIPTVENQPTYLKIWLHGNRIAYAGSSSDNSSVLMFDNGTQLKNEHTTAWILAQGDNNASTMCSNYSNPVLYTISLFKDEIAGVRYASSNHTAVSGFSDFVWVQVELCIPQPPQTDKGFTGFIIIHYHS